MKLGVNIDHVATLREVRGTRYPSPLEAARICQKVGAHSLTVHLREDRRHIQDADVIALCRERILPVNLEMANNPDVLSVALKVKPEEICMVPEKREELTTEGGLDVVHHLEALKNPIAQLKEVSCVVSLFIEPDKEQLEASAALGVPYVELHTGTYCEAVDAASRSHELERLKQAALYADTLGLKVNAGHGLNLENIEPILGLHRLDTLNIGHSIIARALFVGLEAAVREMLEMITT